MKKALLMIVAAFILGGAVTVNAQANETVTLGVNKSRKILDRKVTVKVLAVVEDSRCPQDVQCVQAGNAKVRVSIGKGNSTSKILDLSLNGDNTAKFEDWTIKLDSLTPTPKSAAPIARKEYAATFTVMAG